ncbi:amidohydrolase family protein [Kitasatospora sp. NPDC001159]
MHGPVSYDEAVALHTSNAAGLLGEEHLRGTLTPGRLADLTIWERDPATCPAEGPATSTPPTPWSAAGPSTAPTPPTDCDAPPASRLQAAHRGCTARSQAHARVIPRRGDGLTSTGRCESPTPHRPVERRRSMPS